MMYSSMSILENAVHDTLLPRAVISNVRTLKNVPFMQAEKGGKGYQFIDDKGSIP